MMATTPGMMTMLVDMLFMNRTKMPFRPMTLVL